MVTPAPDPDTTMLIVPRGYWQLVTTGGYDLDGAYCLGGYAIHYDEHGVEIERTPNEWNLRMTVQ